MTRDDIYDHLAQVYLGKRKEVDVEQKKKKFSAWLLINALITTVIFASAVYGLSAFFAHKKPALQSNIIYTLSNGPMTLSYDFRKAFPPVKSLTLSINEIDPSRYQDLNFTIRGKEEGTPGIVKVVFKNKRNEIAAVYVNEVDLDWQDISLPLTKFKEISDWSSVTEVSFVLESWNVDDKTGIVLIDDVQFASINL